MAGPSGFDEIAPVTETHNNNRHSAYPLLR
jgi:hypothetical protein